MQLLYVQSDNLNSNYFHHNLFTTTNQPTFPSSSSTFRTKHRSLVFSSKSQTTTPITSIHESIERSIISQTVIDAIYKDTQKKFRVKREGYMGKLSQVDAIVHSY